MRTTGSESASRPIKAGSTWESGWRVPSPTALARTIGAGCSIFSNRRGPWAHPGNAIDPTTNAILPIHRPIRTTPFPGSPGRSRLPRAHCAGSRSSRVAANFSQSRQSRQSQSQPSRRAASRDSIRSFLQRCAIRNRRRLRTLRHGTNDHPSGDHPGPARALGTIALTHGPRPEVRGIRANSR